MFLKSYLPLTKQLYGSTEKNCCLSLPGLIIKTIAVFLSCPNFSGLAKRLCKGMSLQRM